MDDETLRYLRLTGRERDHVDLAERYCKIQGLFREPGGPEPEFNQSLELDLGSVEPSLAGPKRPHDRVALPRVNETFHRTLTAPTNEGGFGLVAAAVDRKVATGSNRESATSLRPSGRGNYNLRGLGKGRKPGGRVAVRAEREDGSEVEFSAQARIDLPIELDYYRNGGILHAVLRGMLP